MVGFANGLLKQTAEMQQGGEVKDLVFVYEGTVTMIIPGTEAGAKWIEDNILYEPFQKLGNNLVVQSQYVEAIYNGAVEDGLNVSAE